MATYHAITTTSEAILGLLKAACPKPEFENVSFELYQSNDIRERNMNQESISLYLYRITVNTARRNLPARLAPDGNRYRPSLPLDLYYLLTVWVKDVRKQQDLFGWCMRALEDVSILPAGLLNHYAPDQAAFRPDETVELICDPLSLQDLTNTLEGFKPNVQLSVGYVVRAVTIDSSLNMKEEAAVQTRVFDFGKRSTQ